MAEGEPQACNPFQQKHTNTNALIQRATTLDETLLCKKNTNHPRTITMSKNWDIEATPITNLQKGTKEMNHTLKTSYHAF